MHSKLFIFGVVASVALIAGGALAEERPACGCTVARGSEGLVRSAIGKVFVSRETGLGPARAEQKFTMPARILTGPKSSSTVQIGNDCKVSITENKSVEIREETGKWCVHVGGGQAAAGVAASAAGAAGTTAGATAAAGSVAAAGTATAGAATATAAAAAAQLVPLGIVSGVAASSVAISTARDGDRVSR